MIPTPSRTTVHAVFFSLQLLAIRLIKTSTRWLNRIVLAHAHHFCNKLGFVMMCIKKQTNKQTNDFKAIPKRIKKTTIAKSTETKRSLAPCDDSISRHISLMMS